MKNLYVQIPLLDDGQCLGIINEVNAFEDIVGGCVVDDSAEDRENHMIDSIRKLKACGAAVFESSLDYSSQNSHFLTTLDISGLDNKAASQDFLPANWFDADHLNFYGAKIHTRWFIDHVNFLGLLDH